MERDFAAYLFTLFCPLFTSGASFSVAHEYSVRKVNWQCACTVSCDPVVGGDPKPHVCNQPPQFAYTLYHGLYGIVQAVV